MPSDLTGTVTSSHDPKPLELPPLPEICLFARPGGNHWGPITVSDSESYRQYVRLLKEDGFATRIVTIQPPPSARGVKPCCGTDLCDPAAEIAQLRLDCKTLAAEVRLRRAVPESSTAELLKAMDAVDASDALTRHTGDGT
jgi:hypothetical protein